MTNLVEIRPVVLEKKLLKVADELFFFAIIFPSLEKKLNSLTQRWFVETGWNWLRGSKEDFIMLSMFSLYFAITSPWIRGRPFIWKKKLCQLFSRIICIKLVWNWRVLLEKMIFKMSSMHFCNNLLLEIFEQIWISIMQKKNGAKFGWNLQSGSGEENENAKSLQIDRWTTGDQNSPNELSVQLS